jgi:iron-sulfur cluster insertion protein
MSMLDQITITDAAKEKINDILFQEGNPNVMLRTFVQGGGCSGFQYGFTLDEIKNEDDWEFDTGSFRVVIDSMSMMYMEGATIDYKEELMSSQFVIKNPNATTSCGCGSSFSV